jgi:hypothetical protein
MQTSDRKNLLAKSTVQTVPLCWSRNCGLVWNQRTVSGAEKGTLESAQSRFTGASTAPALSFAFQEMHNVEVVLFDVIRKFLPMIYDPLSVLQNPS